VRVDRANGDRRKLSFKKLKELRTEHAK